MSRFTDIFFAGPDDWRGRLLPAISFISPDGNEFEAKWAGDSRAFDKKLGIFLYPKVRGNIVQDLDANSTRYSIPFFFDGKDCDKVAIAFFKAAKERGVWTVSHPMHGFLELQLMSIKEDDQPISNGGIIGMETEWIEPIDESTLLTAAEMANLVGDSVDDLNISAAQQFADKLQAGTEALRQNIETFTNGVQNLTDYYLGPLFSVVDSLDNAITAIQVGIQDTLNATVLDTLALAGQIQQLIQLPLLATTDTASRQEAYSDLSDALILDIPATLEGLADTARLQALNQVLITELAVSAIIGANAQIAVTSLSATANASGASRGAGAGGGVGGGGVDGGGTGSSAASRAIVTEFQVVEEAPLETRAKVVAAASATTEAFDTIVDALDLAQKEFVAQDIDRQYFSQSQAYSDAAQATYQAVQYLLISSFDLKVERTIVLQEPKTPIEIAVDEYGTLGGDNNLDLLIRSNNLTSTEIYLLPAGREVIIYA